jgi:hypothetical protein
MICHENKLKKIVKFVVYCAILFRAKLVMEEATLLMKINRNKNTAKAIAREKMIDEFLTKVPPT